MVLVLQVLSVAQSVLIEDTTNLFSEHLWLLWDQRSSSLSHFHM